MLLDSIDIDDKILLDLLQKLSNALFGADFSKPADYMVNVEVTHFLILQALF